MNRKKEIYPSAGGSGLSGTKKDFSDQIINNSRSMITIINRDYIYEKVNETFCSKHKLLSDSSVVGKTLSDVWGEDVFRQQIKKNVDLCFSGKTIRYEARFDTSSSGERYYEVIFRPLDTGSGKISHILAETFDIHDLKQSEHEIIKKEEEFRKFETNLPIGFLRCDPEGRILHANDTLLSILDCPDENTAKSSNLKSFYPDEVLFDIHFEQLRESNAKNFGRIMMKSLKGTDIPCRVSGVMVADEMGQPSYFDFAIEDSSRELMLENRLLEARKLETIGALAGGIAHDFNNIMATISGYSEMLLDDMKGNREMTDKVTKIQRAVTKGQSITDQVLTFSRQIEQDKIAVNVSEVLNETIGFIKMTIPPNVVIKSHIPEQEMTVHADPTQLFRVFLNLMTNAIQAMEEKGGVLTVNLSLTEGKTIKHELNSDIVADEYVITTVADTGTGMESSLIRRIFEPFFTTHEVGKGTGLGLSVVHGIINEMEGEILVSSEKSKGSVFKVYLPVSKNYYTDDDKKSVSRRILLIRGNKFESNILTLALKSTGCSLSYASDKHQLIKALSDNDNIPDMIIMMSDHEKIKAEELPALFEHLNVNIPCLLITDPDQELLGEKLVHSGLIHQHLIKPVSLKEMKQAIQLSFND